MSLTSDIYGIRSCGVSHGDVFTLPRVICFMLDLIGYTSDKDLSKYKILEPSFGNGDFLIEIQRRIIQSSEKFNFDATNIMSQNVYGCEIDEDKYNKCIENIRLKMPCFTSKNLKIEDFLLTTWDAKFDFIIGNPPYIRYENIPQNVINLYKSRFYTFYYRCDLYVLFYEHCLNNLSDNGHHCFICSNRWLKNEYGKRLRALISTSFNLEYIVNVEQLEAFKESVLAYPSITLISKANNNRTKIATVNNLNELKLPLITKDKKCDSSYNWDNLFVDREYDGLCSIEEQGYEIGIGVATGADKLFISRNLQNIVETELLLPIVNTKDLTGDNFNWNEQYLLNPYFSNGSIIDLNNYPKAKQYLTQFKAVLENRHIVKKGRPWFSLIDKIKPNLLKQPKILLPDISGNRIVFVDVGMFYPAHNIYYITGKSLSELEVLAALLMSDFVRRQMECISNKMNGGFPRWQSQSIKRLKLPRINNISSISKQKLISAYHNRNFSEIDKVAEEIVQSQSETSKSHCTNTPKSLFDYDFSEGVCSFGLGIQ